MATTATDHKVADLSLADGEGQALEEGLRALGPGGALPFVFMTGSPIQRRALGGSTVVIKPFDVHEVTTALEDALRPHRFVRRGARPAAVPARTPHQAHAVGRARTGS